MRIALLAVFAIVVLGSCTKKTINNPVVNQAFSAVYKITPDQWTKSTDVNGIVSYYATLQVPELDDIINQNGGVETYMSFDFADAGVTAPTYETLPEVVDGVAYGSLHTTGVVTIDLNEAYGASLTSAIGKTVQVKVVLIDAAPLD